MKQFCVLLCLTDPGWAEGIARLRKILYKSLPSGFGGEMQRRHRPATKGQLLRTCCLQQAAHRLQAHDPRLGRTSVLTSAVGGAWPATRRYRYRIPGLYSRSRSGSTFLGGLTVALWAPFGRCSGGSTAVGRLLTGR